MAAAAASVVAASAAAASVVAASVVAASVVAASAETDATLTVRCEEVVTAAPAITPVHVLDARCPTDKHIDAPWLGAALNRCQQLSFVLLQPDDPEPQPTASEPHARYAMSACCTAFRPVDMSDLLSNKYAHNRVREGDVRRALHVPPSARV